MANSRAQPSDVINGADALMLTLVQEASAVDPETNKPLSLDKKLAIMQTATRWVAVKNRLSAPDERNGFDEFREQFGGAAPARDAIAGAVGGAGGASAGAASARSAGGEGAAGPAAQKGRSRSGTLNHAARHPSGRTDRGPPKHPPRDSHVTHSPSHTHANSSDAP